MERSQRLTILWAATLAGLLAALLGPLAPVGLGSPSAVTPRSVVWAWGTNNLGQLSS